MTTEPNLRSFERNYSGIPYGYGHLPVTYKSWPPGDTLRAVSRPQLIRKKDRGSGGHSHRKHKRSWLEADTFSELSQMFGDWLGELPGFFTALAGLLASPLKLLHWLLSKTGICGLILTMIGLLIIGSLVPMFTTSSCREPRRAEGEQLLGAMRDFCRIQYSKSGSADEVRKALKKAVRRGDFDGEYFRAADRLEVLSPDKARIWMYGMHPKETDGYMEFVWASGESNIVWPGYRCRR